MKHMVTIDRSDIQEENKDDYPHFVFPAQYLRRYNVLIFKSNGGGNYHVPASYLIDLHKMNIVYFQDNSHSHLIVSDFIIDSFKVS